jgi:hypothetical protein
MPTKPNIKSVSFPKGAAIAVEYNYTTDNDDAAVQKLKIYESPQPDLINILNKLRQPIIQFMHWDSEIWANSKINTIHLKRDAGSLGAKFTLRLEMEDTDIQVLSDDPGFRIGVADYMKWQLLEQTLMTKLHEELALFIKGKRVYPEGPKREQCEIDFGAVGTGGDTVAENAGADMAEDSDSTGTMESADVSVPSPKKRGRPRGSTNKSASKKTTTTRAKKKTGVTSKSKVGAK